MKKKRLDLVKVLLLLKLIKLSQPSNYPIKIKTKPNLKRLLLNNPQPALE